jgi:hypothetical protein
MRDARESRAEVDSQRTPQGRVHLGFEAGHDDLTPELRVHLAAGQDLRPAFSVQALDEGVQFGLRPDNVGNGEGRDRAAGREAGVVHSGTSSADSTAEPPVSIPFRRPGLTGLAGADWLRDWPRRRRPFPYRLPLLGEVR